MWLDQYAYAAKGKKIIKKKDWENFYEESDDPEELISVWSEKIEIAFWRKHRNLQGWMTELWRKKNKFGSEYSNKDFNLEELILTEEDLNLLESDVLSKNLPETQDIFFFGSEKNDYYKDHDLNFIARAREYIKDGYTVYYLPWY